jgi:hypothetical protein
MSTLAQVYEADRLKAHAEHCCKITLEKHWEEHEFQQIIDALNSNADPNRNNLRQIVATFVAGVMIIESQSRETCGNF